MNPMQDLAHSLPYVRPELLLAGYAMFATLMGAWNGEKAFGWISALGVVVLAGAGIIAISIGRWLQLKCCKAPWS